MKKVNHKLVPVNYPGQGRTVESSAEACLLRCKNAPGCVGSAFWWSDGGCHLSTHGSVFKKQNGVIAYYCEGKVFQKLGLDLRNALCVLKIRFKDNFVFLELIQNLTLIVRGTEPCFHWERDYENERLHQLVNFSELFRTCRPRRRGVVGRSLAKMSTCGTSVN